MFCTQQYNDLPIKKILMDFEKTPIKIQYCQITLAFEFNSHWKFFWESLHFNNGIP